MKEIARKRGLKLKGRPTWNKGLTKDTNVILKKMGESQKTLWKTAEHREKMAKSGNCFLNEHKEISRKGGLLAYSKRKAKLLVKGDDT